MSTSKLSCPVRSHQWLSDRYCVWVWFACTGPGIHVVLISWCKALCLYWSWMRKFFITQLPCTLMKQKLLDPVRQIDLTVFVPLFTREIPVHARYLIWIDTLLCFAMLFDLSFGLCFALVCFYGVGFGVLFLIHLIRSIYGFRLMMSQTHPSQINQTKHLKPVL